MGSMCGGDGRDLVARRGPRPLYVSAARSRRRQLTGAYWHAPAQRPGSGSVCWDGAEEGGGGGGGGAAVHAVAALQGQGDGPAEDPY